MSEQLSTLDLMASAALVREPTPTAQRIREVISQLRATPMANDVDDENAEHLAKELEVRFAILMPIGSVLTGRGHEPWLEVARVDIESVLLGQIQAIAN